MRIESERVALRHATLNDAEFILSLVNDPDWIKYIGDKNVYSIEDAEEYIQQRLIASYNQHGFGLYVIERQGDGELMGLCGLVKREELDDVDLGYALAANFRGSGYAFEAAQLTLKHAKDELNIHRILAITAPHNEASVALLTKLNFAFIREQEFFEKDRVKLFLYE